MTREYMPIPTDILHRYVGRKVHVAWAQPGCHWTLEQIDGDEAVLGTNRGKLLRAKATDLRAVRGNEHLATSKRAQKMCKPAEGEGK